MNTEAQKICPYCAEIIPVAAKLCPHCRQWLSLRSFRHPAVIICVGIIFVLGMGFTISRFFNRLSNPSPYYDEFLGSIKIIDSRMNWVEREKEPSSKENRIYITGVITNQSPVAWRHIEFECRFFDTNGTMIDAENGFTYFTIQPNDNSAFRVSVEPTAPTNQYASFKVFATTARNTKGWF